MSASVVILAGAGGGDSSGFYHAEVEYFHLTGEGGGVADGGLLKLLAHVGAEGNEGRRVVGEGDGGVDVARQVWRGELG